MNTTSCKPNQTLSAELALMRLVASTRTWIDNGFGIVLNCWDRARQRQQLAQLDDRLLKDVGLTWVDAQREAAKPFWKD